MGFAPEFYFKEGCFISEWLNNDVDPAVSIARARVEPGQTTRWHRLKDVTERYLILAGQGLAEVGKEEAHQLGPGDAIVIPPGSRQRIQNTGDGDLVFLAICTPRFTPECYEWVDD